MTPFYALHRYGYSLLAQRFDKPGCSHSTAWVKWMTVTIFLSSSLSSSPFHSVHPPFTPHFVANLPTLPVQIDKFNQRQKNKWKREKRPLKGIIFAEGKMWFTAERGRWTHSVQTATCKCFSEHMKTVSKLKQQEMTGIKIVISRIGWNF